ncbi:hypothetical protein L916_03207, partial [Phytophthora nicotianae]
RAIDIVLLRRPHHPGEAHCVWVTQTRVSHALEILPSQTHAERPGSWNDGDTSLDFCRKLFDVTLNQDARYGVVAVGALPCGDKLIERVLKEETLKSWYHLFDLP